MPPVVTYLTDTALTSWTVPADWNNTNNKVEIISRAGDSAGTGPSGGSAGGMYAKVSNLTLTPLSSVDLQIGGASGEDTWFNGATYGAASVAAKCGGDASGGTGGIAPDATAGIGDVVFKGGNGGNASGSSNGGGAGGGAGGPNGAGADGGNVSAGLTTGPGGGAANGGSVGQTNTSNTAPGNGGNNRFSTGAGAAGAATGTGNPGGNGSNGGGGGGANTNGTNDAGADNLRKGGQGGMEDVFGSSHGPAGGSGGPAAFVANFSDGTAGADYGGGASGGTFSPNGAGALGGRSIIVITYTPVVTTTGWWNYFTQQVISLGSLIAGIFHNV